MQGNTPDTRDTHNANDTQRNSLGKQIERRLHGQLGVHLVVATTADTIFLDGQVRSPEQRDHAVRLATELAPGKRVENNLEVQQFVTATETNPHDEAGEVIDEQNINDLRDEESLRAQERPSPDDFDAGALRLPASADELDDPTLLRESQYFDTSLADQPLETNELNVVDDSVYDADASAEPDAVYFPPTDPVTAGDEQGRLTVVGGFNATSMDDETMDASAEDHRPGDEALADAIRRELREDAATTDLWVDVHVVRGVAHLHGTVPNLEDAENAESVASSVPGVLDVDEHLDVQNL